MNKILVVDDDEYICELVCTLLKNEGFIPFAASDGRMALQKISEIHPDICIIDIMMPNMDGFQLCQKLRQYYEDIPILMLTAKDDITQKMKGFALGTDDYLTKPFDPIELVLRVKALLRRYKTSSSEIIQVGYLKIDKSSHTLYVKDERIDDIPMKEFELLFELARAQGRTFTRGQLIEEIWGYDFDGNERTLDVHINRLRERFPSDRCGFKIVTIRGIGYRLEGMK